MPSKRLEHSNLLTRTAESIVADTRAVQLCVHVARVRVSVVSDGVPPHAQERRSAGFARRALNSFRPHREAVG